MPKRILPLCLMILLLLAGCGKHQNIATPLTTQFTCDFSATYQDMQLAGSLQRQTAGTLTVDLIAPASLSGLTVTWDGEHTTVSLGILQYTLDEDLPQTASLKLLLGVLDDLFTDAAQGTLVPDGAVFTGTVGEYAYQVVTDAASGTLLTLEVPKAALKVQFSQVTRQT